MRLLFESSISHHHPRYLIFSIPHPSRSLILRSSQYDLVPLTDQQSLQPTVFGTVQLLITGLLQPHDEDANPSVDLGQKKIPIRGQVLTMFHQSERPSRVLHKAFAIRCPSTALSQDTRALTEQVTS